MGAELQQRPCGRTWLLAQPALPHQHLLDTVQGCWTRPQLALRLLAACTTAMLAMASHSVVPLFAASSPCVQFLSTNQHQPIIVVCESKSVHFRRASARAKLHRKAQVKARRHHLGAQVGEAQGHPVRLLGSGRSGDGQAQQPRVVQLESNAALELQGRGHHGGLPRHRDPATAS